MDDPAALEIWNHRLAEIAEEMGFQLERAALSPNIKERHDCSSALFSPDGRLAAQAADIPVHLGSMPLSVQAVIARFVGEEELSDGEVAIVNDPYAGGSHLPDVTLVAPVFEGGRRIGWVASRAHHADVGGATPGSMGVGTRALGDALPEAETMPPAMGPRYEEFAHVPAPLVYRPMTIDEEGQRIPPTRLTDALAERFAAGCRAPDERRGDLAAQRASIEIGRRGLARLVAEHGADRVLALEDALIDYAARLMRARIAAIPDGVYAFADSLDDDGAGTRDVALRATLSIEGEHATVDFSDSDDEVQGSLNAVGAVTLSAV
ncbi:MAG TPA: hydantoinase B/oxoprolinase family protein, partial [Polyangia bacterium]